MKKIYMYLLDAMADREHRYQHTSNALFYLQSIDTYKGYSYYIDKVAVQDQNLITASFVGSLLWTKYIMENLKLYSEQTLDAWYRFFLLVRLNILKN